MISNLRKRNQFTGAVQQLLQQGKRRFLALGGDPELLASVRADVERGGAQLHEAAVDDRRGDFGFPITHLEQETGPPHDALLLLSPLSPETLDLVLSRQSTVPDLVHCQPPPPACAVVSIWKSGTNLVSRLLAELGFKPVGHGIQETFELVVQRWREANPSTELTVDRVQHPDFLRFLLRAFPSGHSLFLHSLPLAAAPREMLTHGRPVVLFHCRDPRDVLLSAVHYSTKLSPTAPLDPATLVLAATMRGSAQLNDRLRRALACGGEGFRQMFEEHRWMLHHPAICRTSYESLVGPEGGGTAQTQLATVARVMVHLGATGDPAAIARSVYSTSARTFHRGQARGWSHLLDAAAQAWLMVQIGDLVQTYGYCAPAAAATGGP